MTHSEAGKMGGRGKKASSDATGFKRDMSYLLARLERDHPDIDPSKYPSVRQAAIAAGIVKVPSVYDQIIKLFSKLTASEKIKLIAWISVNNALRWRGPMEGHPTV